MRWAGVMEDFRVKTSWRTHYKRKKLQRRLGVDGVIGIVDLWGYAADCKEDGDLSGMDAEAIAIAAQYDGDESAFATLLVELELLDGEPGGYSLHNWRKHNPYVATHGKRSEAAKKAANARWAKRGHADAMPNDAESNALRIDPQCPVSVPVPVPVPDSTAQAELRDIWPKGIGTAVDLEQAASAWGWSAGNLTRATRARCKNITDADPIDAAEMENARAKTDAKGITGNRALGFFLSVAEGDRDDAAKVTAKGPGAGRSSGPAIAKDGGPIITHKNLTGIGDELRERAEKKEAERKAKEASTEC